MQLFSRLLLISGFIYSASSNALEMDAFHVFADVLYWEASENVDWAYENSLTTPHQTITYESGEFGFEPGFRVGIGYGEDWDTGIYYTRYTTETSDSATGNLKTGFFGGTAGLPIGHPFYNSGQFKMNIDFNMFDWYLGKRFDITPSLSLHPTIGLEGGWIDQSIRADFQGFYSTTEKLENNFWGVGPKFGIDGNLVFLRKPAFTASLIAEFSAAYLLGNWEITDVFSDNEPRTIDIDLDDRNMGALALQGKLGVGLAWDKFAISLNYEINDWFEQLQIFDDASGGHNDDLVMQGLTLRLSGRL